MMHNRLLPGLTATLLMALPAAAATGHYAIGSDRVAAAMSSFGMQVTPGQIAMMNDAVATTPAPQLQIQSVQRWPGNRVVVRVACAIQQECLPFFVSVRLDQQAPAINSAAAPALTRVAASVPSEFQAPPPHQSAKAGVRSGQSAVLLIDGLHIHIRVAVVCLDNGAIGQTVHATDVHHQQAYLAQVVGDGILRGRL